jgi:hypothetical protein
MSGTVRREKEIGYEGRGSGRVEIFQSLLRCHG